MLRRAWSLACATSAAKLRVPIVACMPEAARSALRRALKSAGGPLEIASLLLRATVEGGAASDPETGEALAAHFAGDDGHGGPAADAMLRCVESGSLLLLSPLLLLLRLLLGRVAATPATTPLPLRRATAAAATTATPTYD